MTEDHSAPLTCVKGPWCHGNSGFWQPPEYQKFYFLFKVDMTFDRLDVDVLLRIFYLSDVYTILSLSRVCKGLYTISCMKHLWILVLQDLSQRGLVSPSDPSSWENSSADELVNEVRCTVVGPRTWDRGVVATIQRQITIPLGHQTGGTGEFLHGGRIQCSGIALSSWGTLD
ncbi:hypothetical protein C8F04DRAFT_1194375 [Mycena alexandri]|uniref:F-box domain-containing protein n=1 Tax=Mycena alexandri TaxID=1745969 RepID=A0AAD6S8W3_9AGAR|nr:hypothetical protein C8F04DRAFT_1194375 [Mycena alexandri]